MTILCVEQRGAGLVPILDPQGDTVMSRERKVLLNLAGTRRVDPSELKQPIVCHNTMRDEAGVHDSSNRRPDKLIRLDRLVT